MIIEVGVLISVDGDVEDLILPDYVHTIAKEALRKHPNLRTLVGRGVTHIEDYGLCECFELTSAELPSLVTVGDGLLTDCYKLTSAELPSLVTVGHWLLADCYKLTSVELPKLETAGDGLLTDCSELTSVELPSLVTVGHWLLADCHKLTSVELASLVTVGDGLLADCSEFNSLTVTTKLKKIGVDHLTTFELTVSDATSEKDAQRVLDLFDFQLCP
jgi:hypothetical protein